MSKKYYSVSGANGVGVYTIYEKVERNMKYLAKGSCKGFKSLEEASVHAKARFNELCEDNFFYVGPLVLNFCLTIAQMEKIYELGLAGEKMVKVKFKNGKATFEKI